MKEFDLKKHITYIIGNIESSTPKDIMDFFAEMEVDDINVNKTNKNDILSVYPDIQFKPVYPDVKINLCCNGGGVYYGLSIYDIIKSHQDNYNIKIECSGLVASAAMFILMSVPKANRVCHKNTTFLIHQVSTIIAGLTKEIEDEAIECKRLTDIMFNIILSETKISSERFKEVYEKKTDWIIDAEEALKLGIVGKIID